MRTILARAKEDLATIVARDPSTSSRAEALLHPALPALWGHRLSHALHNGGHRHLARLVAYGARSATGIEIHPGAQLGRRVFIDHGAATVIGETARIGDDVTIFHQVTIGALGWWRDATRPAGERRHPVIGDRVVLGVNATVLGPITVGDDALIGAGTMVLSDIPAAARVLTPPSHVLSGPRPRDAIELVSALRAIASAGSW